ncbi:MAG: isochorismatase family cysteine hydrolase [Chloroflexota bacterium]
MTASTVLSLPERVDPRSTALIVVDVQNDFCHSESPLVAAGNDVSAAQEMVPTLVGLVDDARRAGTTVIWVKMIHTEHTVSRAATDHRMRTRPGSVQICQEGSWGAGLYQVEPAAGEPVVTKHRYSAFVDTDLELILRSRGITSVVLTGVATNVCVESTARDAYMRDYHVVFVDDCSAAYSAEKHAATLRNMNDHFGVVVNAADLAEAWAAVPALAR